MGSGSRSFQLRGRKTIRLVGGEFKNASLLLNSVHSVLALDAFGLAQLWGSPEACCITVTVPRTEASSAFVWPTSTSILVEMAIRGTSASQDGRYFAQEKKLLAKMTFPKCFEERVDMRKVQREVINQWVTERITQLLGFEDDIVVSMAINLLESKVDEKLDPKQLQMALTGFLEKQTGPFTEELWNLLLSAQSNPTGIPSVILDKKKQEMQSIAEEKDKLKKVLDTKRKQVAQSTGDIKRRPDREATNKRRSPERGPRVERRRSRSLQRRPRSPPRRFRSPRRRSRSPRKRSRSPRRRSPSLRRRSRSSPRGRSRRGRSRSLSVKRRRRSSSGSPDRSRERRRQRSPRRSRRSRRSSSSSSSVSRHRSPSSSRSRSPRRRSSRSRRKYSSESDSGSD